MTQGGIEVLLGSLMALPILLEHFRWHIVTLYSSWMTQGGIEVLLGSLMALATWIEHSRWHEVVRDLIAVVSLLTTMDFNTAKQRYIHNRNQTPRYKHILYFSVEYVNI